MEMTRDLFGEEDSQKLNMFSYLDNTDGARDLCGEEDS
jgi:hypothetical protein